MIQLTSKAKGVIVWNLEVPKMADSRKESQAMNGEIILLRDPSDQAYYAQTVGLIKDFSDSVPRLVDVDLNGTNQEQSEDIKVENKQKSNVSNLDGLPLPVFASRLREKRVRQLTKLSSKKAA
jgi:hypothetical protein